MELNHRQKEEESSIENLPLAENDYNISLSKPRIFEVHEAHKSRQTAKKYRTNFKHFMNYLPSTLRDLQVLLDVGKEGLQEWVIKYTLSLRDNAEKKYR